MEIFWLSHWRDMTCLLQGSDLMVLSLIHLEASSPSICDIYLNLLMICSSPFPCPIFPEFWQGSLDGPKNCLLLIFFSLSCSSLSLCLFLSKFLRDISFLSHALDSLCLAVVSICQMLFLLLWMFPFNYSNLMNSSFIFLYAEKIY